MVRDQKIQFYLIIFLPFIKQVNEVVYSKTTDGLHFLDHIPTFIKQVNEVICSTMTDDYHFLDNILQFDLASE